MIDCDILLTDVVQQLRFSKSCSSHQGWFQGPSRQEKEDARLNGPLSALFGEVLLVVMHVNVKKRRDETGQTLCAFELPELTSRILFMTMLTMMEPMLRR
jgi:hypothetical protein